MALFGLGDIKFKKGEVRSGPLAPLTSSQYENTNFRFPLDIGNADKGHYMTFYIKEQEKTGFGGEGAAMNMESEVPLGKQAAAAQSMSGSISGRISSVSNKVSGSLGAGQNFASGVTSKISAGIGKVGDALGGIGEQISSIGGNVQAGLNNVFGQKKLPLGGNSAAQRSIISTNVKAISEDRGAGGGGLARTVNKTNAAITLYMPDTLLYNFTQSFQSASPGKEFGGQVAAASGVDEASLTGMGNARLPARENLKRPLAEVVGRAAGNLTGSDDTAKVALAGAFGSVVNPMLEMIYSSPNFRSFQFDFNFYPRDEREALEVQKILKMFMFHQAPEVLKGSPGFLVPPSEFDIKFYYAGKENPNIPVIAPNCILTTIDINYAPQGASFYEVPGEISPSLGGTGMPFAVNLVLQFQETVFLTKDDLKNEDFKQKTSSDGSVTTETSDYSSYRSG